MCVPTCTLNVPQSLQNEHGAVAALTSVQSDPIVLRLCFIQSPSLPSCRQSQHFLRVCINLHIVYGTLITCCKYKCLWSMHESNYPVLRFMHEQKILWASLRIKQFIYLFALRHFKLTFSTILKQSASAMFTKVHKKKKKSLQAVQKQDFRF